MRQISSSNHSSSCTAIFLSYFTRSVWTPVGCNMPLQRNHFICEMKAATKASRHSYIHSATTCPSNSTYVHESCWYVSTERRSTVHMDVTSLSKVFGYISAWSLGQSNRTTLELSSKNNDIGCLKTNGFEIQQLKNWLVVSKCNASYSLVRRNPLYYRDRCEGTYSLLNESELQHTGHN